MELLRVPWIASCKYPKIETLYERERETFKVQVGKMRKPEFAIVRNWLVTEKIDGTNIRVILYPDGRVSFRGRTDNAQLYPKLVDVLNHMFPEGTTQALYPDQQKKDTPYPWTILYGEGYGEKIQKGGGNYREGQSFRLFDVLIIPQEVERGWWQEWDTVCKMAERLGVETVPFHTGMEELPMLPEELLAWFPASEVARREKSLMSNPARLPEGVVARTNPLLFNRLGERVMWKLKLKDFPDDT